MKRSTQLLLLLLFIVLAVGLRSINLLSFPLYIDEGIYLSWAKLFSQSREYAYVSLNDGKTPLFMWLTAVVSPLFSSTFQAGRTVSVVMGVGTAVIWALITQLLLSRKHRNAYLLSALILPYAYFVERLAFVDSMVTMLISTSFLFWILVKKALEHRKAHIVVIVSLAALSGISLAIAYMTKTSARLFLVSHVLLAIVWIVEYGKKREIRKTIISILSVLSFLGMYREITGYMRTGAARFWSGIISKEAELTYSPNEIIQNLLTTPQIYVRSLSYSLQYFALYLAGIGILTLVSLGVLYVLRKGNKESRQHFTHSIWLVLYCSVAISGSLLAARNPSSRYFYPVIPAVMAFSTLGSVWLWEQRKLLLRSLVGFLLFITAGCSVYMILDPLHFPYAANERNFTQGDVSALGLPEIASIIDPDSSVVAVTGIWGVQDGAVIYLQEAGMEAMPIDAPVKQVFLVGQECAQPFMRVEEQCYTLNSDQLNQSKKPNKYFYLTHHQDQIAMTKQFPNIKVIKVFERPGGLKTYLLQYTALEN